MILALDGNVYTGKTTLARTIASRMRYTLIPEYCEYVTPSRYGDASKALQRAYLDAERERKKSLPSASAVLDRSIVSQAAHVWARYMLEEEDTRQFFLDELKLMFQKGEIIVPDIHVHLRLSYDTLTSRFETMNEVSEKGTPRQLVRRGYLTHVDAFNEALVHMLKGISVDTGEDMATILSTVERFINANPGMQGNDDTLFYAIQEIFEKGGALG